MNGMKTPEILRLDRIARWAEARHKRAMTAGDTARAMRTAALVTTVEARANAVALAAVSPYRGD